MLSTAFPLALFEAFLAAQKSKQLTVSGAGNSTAKAIAIAKLLETKSKKILWLTQDAGEARAAAAQIQHATNQPVHVLRHEPGENRRAELLAQLQLARQLGEENGIFVISYQDSHRRLPDLARLQAAAIELKAGESISRTDLFNDIIRAGYELVVDTADLQPGNYAAPGSAIHVWPVGTESPAILDLDGERIESIIAAGKEKRSIQLLPISEGFSTANILQAAGPDALIIADEIILDEDNEDERHLPPVSDFLAEAPENAKIIFTSFPEDETDFIHLRFLSVLKYVTPLDFLADLRMKKELGWRVVLATKQRADLEGILKEKEFVTHKEISPEPGVSIAEFGEEDTLPFAFQNPELKIAIITDREIFGFQRAGKNISEQKVYLDFITSLRSGDYVVHADHGIGIFRGIESKTIEQITREYLRLDYAAGDKLFVPIDQAEKVTRFIGTGDEPPRLTRLGSAEWSTAQSKVKAETEKIAKELLKLYAQRAAASGHGFGSDGGKQAAFEAGFQYEETPGQLKAIMDVKADMEAERPMDRLICGDVGFGKTEVAMRAAFKAVMAGKQVAFISPITILADQHYQGLAKRLQGFDVSCELLSRFRTPAEQKKVLAGLADGSVQIVVGTHRLLQEDVVFKDLGLVIIDEEQRFGVQQKEKLKSLRNSVDLLTMSATPIPRTLNMALNKLRDITTITTPPPGRLPIITEVRHFSWKLIEEAIRQELDRKGQVYFLHNRVATIESVAQQLRELIPDARFVVTHGQLKSDDLEDRILDFKHGKYDVLVSSAIIENGIDLPNANTLIVNDAEMFGLSQLYQLRGRVGRSKTQAYAYFLYKTKSLKTDAKKRLRAIVEASELGSGFEIAMKDLEIRGAGEILGASQSGAMQAVGVSHFVRMLNQAVEDLKLGKEVGAGLAKQEEKAEVALELPINAFIPPSFISDTKEKIRAYQRLSAADNEATLDSLRMELSSEYGKLPIEVINLLQVLRLRLLSRAAGVLGIKVGQSGPRTREAVIACGKQIKPAHIMSALAKNAKWAISGDKLRIDVQHLGIDWMRGLIETVEALQVEYRADLVQPKS